MATGTASEREVLESWLDFHRGVAVRKVADLTMSNAQTRLVPSQSTLAGLLHHLAATEHEWFQEVLPANRRGRAMPLKSRIPAGSSARTTP